MPKIWHITTKEYGMNTTKVREIAEKKRIFRERYQSSFLTKKEVAQELNISCSTLDRMRKEGLLASRRIRGSVMFSIDEIVRVVEG